MRYGIQELAELAGVSRRTVRYYVQRGLLPAPTGTGRGKHYTDLHLEALVRVRALQERGVPLDRIPAQLDGAESPPARPAPSAPAPVAAHRWLRLELDDGVELLLRDAPPLAPHRLRRLTAAIRAALGPEPEPEPGPDPDPDPQGDPS